jgi:hypothetical protein
MLDPSAAVAKLFEGMAKQAGSKALHALFGGLSKFVDAVRMNFSDYLYSTIDRTSHVKTLLHRDERVNLFSIYVETFLTSVGKTVRDNKIVDELRNSAALFVTGSAGAGKSMFIRYLFLQLVEGSFGVIPIFIELRGLNSPQYKDDLIQFFYESVVRPGAVVTKDQFKQCLRENMFILILDGLDEVEHDRRLSVERQIANVREAYPDLGIIITSRPDDRLVGWNSFKIYHIEPLKKSQLLKLIRKLPYDPELRAYFIREVNEHLYTKYYSFLSNPLLAIMMLMTFDQFAHIPDKIHIFYDQAFETLFFRHDAGKQAAFRRKMYTDLAINDFKNCLSAICVSSYFKEKYQFNEAEILDFIRTAAQSEKVVVIECDYLRDLLESVCMLRRDGLFISFTHRSFQEYFTALFIARNPPISTSPLLDNFCGRRNSNVISMAFDMNRPLIEREWILPRISNLERRIKGVNPDDNLVAFLRVLGIHLFHSQGEKEYSAFLQSGAPYFFVSQLEKCYKGQLNSLMGIFLLDDNDRHELGKHGKSVIRAGKSGERTIKELQTTDHEWLKETTLAQKVPDLRNALLGLAAEVRVSVSQQKRLAGALFE